MVPGHATYKLTIDQLDELWTQLAELKQGDESLEDYYERVKITLQDLELDEDATLTICEKWMLNHVIANFVAGIQDSKLRYKVQIKYVAAYIDENRKSLKGAYEASERQLRVLKAKKLAQQEEDEKIKQAQAMAIAAAVKEYVMGHYTAEAIRKFQASLFDHYGRILSLNDHA